MKKRMSESSSHRIIVIVVPCGGLKESDALVIAKPMIYRENGGFATSTEFHRTNRRILSPPTQVGTL